MDPAQLAVQNSIIDFWSLVCGIGSQLCVPCGFCQLDYGTIGWNWEVTLWPLLQKESRVCVWERDMESSTLLCLARTVVSLVLSFFSTAVVSVESSAQRLILSTATPHCSRSASAVLLLYWSKTGLQKNDSYQHLPMQRYVISPASAMSVHISYPESWVEFYLLSIISL